MAANQFVPITDLPPLPGAPGFGHALAIQAVGVTYQVDARQFPLINDMLLTWSDQRAALPGSRFVVAGTGISLGNNGDQLIINATNPALVVSLVAGNGIAVDSSDPLNPIVSMAPAFSNATLLTVGNETASYPNSRRVLAGTNITFDDSVPGVRTVNVGSGGQVNSVVGTANQITVNSADPANPIVSLAVAVLASLSLANTSLQAADIGVSVQAYSANLDAWSALATSAKQDASAKLTAYAGGDTPSAFTLSIVDSVDAAAWRTALGVGTGTGTVTSITVGTGLVATPDPIVTTGTISLGSVLLAYAGGDTPSAFTLGIVDSVDAAAWRTALGVTSSSPGGSNTQVQFNDSGVFGGDAGFTYNKATDTVTLTGAIVTGADGSGVGVYATQALRFTVNGDCYIDFSHGGSAGGLNFRSGLGTSLRVFMKPTGGMNINQPDSGVALSVAGISGTSTILMSSSGAASSAFIGFNLVLGASQWTFGTQSTDPLGVGTAGAAALTLYTNSIARMAINGTTGAITVADASGSNFNFTSGGAVNGTLGASIAGSVLAFGNYIASGHAEIVSGSPMLYGTVGAFNVLFATNSLVRISINSAGNVVVAAPSSGHTVTAVNLSGASAFVALASAGTSAAISVAGNGTTPATDSFDLIQGPSSEGYLYLRSNAALTIGTNNAPRIVVQAAGNVVINAPSSGNALMVDTAGLTGGVFLTGIGQARFTSSVGSVITVLASDAGGTGLTGTLSAHPFNIYTNTALRINITSAGNVIIAAPTSGSPLTISDSGNVGGIQNGLIVQSQNATVNTAYGWVGLNTNSSTYSIQVNGTTILQLGTAIASVNDAGTMREAGYRHLPPILYGGGTLTLTDNENGKCIVITGASTITGYAAADGVVISFIVGAASTMVAGSGTLYWCGGAGSFPTGTRTLAIGAVVTMLRYGGAWYTWGNGIT